MKELKTNFPEKSGEYGVVQLEMDSTQYLWTGARDSREDTVYHFSRHGGCLAYLLEEVGGRFGLYSRPGYPDLGLYKKWTGRRPTPEEKEDPKTYNTVHDQDRVMFWHGLIPAPSGDGYRVLGMGEVRIDIKKKTARFYGKSRSYNIGLDKEQLSLLERLNPDWNIKK